MVEERIYTIPLRKEFLKAPKYKRTSKSVKAVRKFLKKHMKSDNIKLGKYLNLELWQHGRKNPPSKIQVKVTKEDDVVKAELINAPEEKIEEKKKEEKVEEKEKKEKTEKEKVLEKGIDKKERKVEALKETPKEEEEGLQRARNIIPKDEKPHHEKKR